MTLCPFCNGMGYTGGAPDFIGDEYAVTLAACGECQPGLFDPAWGEEWSTRMGKAGLVKVLADYIDECYEEEGGGPAFRAYMQGVVDTTEAVFGDEAVGKVLRAVGRGARDDWFDNSRSPYGREGY